jgi:L-fuculose-phosphate aldolase
MTSPDDLIGELIDAGRHAVAHRLALASSGNLSARLPGTDGILVTGAGTWLDRLTPADFAVIGLDGVRRAGPEPSVEWRLHLQVHAARPDVVCVIHLHPQTAVLLDALGQEIRLITMDHAYYLGRIARVRFEPAGSPELADATSAAARDANAIVMAFHGSTTLGDSVAMALRRALNLEDAATATFRCLQLGNADLAFPAEWAGRIGRA